LAVRKNARSSAKKHPTGDSIEKPLRLSFQPAQGCLQITLRAVHKKPLRAVYKKPLRAVYKKPLRAVV
jgi:hypothetical protein